MSKAIAVIEKKGDPVLVKANKLEITTDKELKEGVDLLSQLNKVLDSATEEKEKVTKPLNQALKAERNRWKPLETTLEDAIGSLRQKISSYQTEKVRAQKEEEDAIANRVGSGKGKISLETAEKRMAEVDQVDSSVAADAGSVQFRTVKKFEIVDTSLVPMEYHLIDDVAVRNAMKNGIELPGIRYYEEQVPYNNR